MKELDNKNKGFTLIELLAVIIIISVIAVVAVPKILDVIENSKRQTSIESGQLYARAVNQNMTFSDLDSSKYKSFFKSGKSVYSVKELSSVTVKNKPKSGSVTINDKRVVGANLCINEYNVIYNNGKWSAEKSDKCSTTSTIDPSTLPKYEENEVIYFDPINYKLCDNETDTCYAQLVLHGNTDEGKYELVYKNTGVYDYGKALENNNGSSDGALVNYINIITDTWSDKIPKPEAKNTINEITIRDSVTTIGNSILGNRVVNTLNIGDGVASIDSNMFNKLIVSNLNLGKNSSKSQEILEGGFKGLDATKEKTINIYGSVKKIGINSFGSLNIQNLTLNEGITQISMNAFQSNNIKSVTIPSTVTSVDDYLFYNNTNLTVANDNSGLLTCNMVSTNTTINNKKTNTSLTCTTE